MKYNRNPLCRRRIHLERCPSGQREQTVNLPADAFGGSNPPLSISSEIDLRKS